MANRLLDLKKYGQSIWYDNLNRGLIVSGDLQRLVDEDGVTGGTSNPSIFEKAVAGGDYYDADIERLTREGKDLPAIYDELTVTDVQQSADVFRPAFDEARGRDGHASIEVSPELAYDTEGSVAAARRLFAALDRPNTMIKIPGTAEGLPAIQKCLADGININITLLFGVENYEQVAWAYIAALEKRWAANEPIDGIASVASFFVSRVDTMIDEQLQKMVEAAAESSKSHVRSLLGKAGVANARIAYAKYKEIFSSTRWKMLEAAGARPQRCLWASTSTKNPDYRDVMYIEPLIGRDTVNTMTQATIDAFRDHGVAAASLEQGVDEAFETVSQLEEAGIDFRAATDELQVQGVKLFTDSFTKANATIQQKRDALMSRAQA